MGYTAAEKALGRAFRTAAQADLDARFAAENPTHEVPTVLGLYRHACLARAGRSAALPLHEVYLPSPAGDGVPAGRFAFVYKTGRCRACAQSALSRTGRLVDAHDRPPLHGRVARGETRYGQGQAPTAGGTAMSTRKAEQPDDAPDLEPAKQETIPGPTYENPNEDQTYVPPEDDPALKPGARHRRDPDAR